MAKSTGYDRTFRLAEVVEHWIDQGGARLRRSVSYKHPTFQAIQIDDEMTKAAVLVRLQLEDQNFALRATPWERFYCQPLVTRNGNPFLPVVTEAGAVVGYCGRALGSHIWSQDAFPLDMQWNEFADSGIAASYANPKQEHRKEWQQAGFTCLDSQRRYTVICSIDGEVLQMVGGTDEGAIESEGIGPIELLLDILTGAYAVKGLAKGMVKRILAMGSVRGIKALVRQIGATVGAKLVRKRSGDALAAEIRRKFKKIGVNLGGTGEMANYINVNNLIGGQKAGAIPNLIRGNAEDVASFFSPGSVDHVVANNIVSGTFDWLKVAKGSHTVLKEGGEVGFAEFAGGALRGRNIKAALEAAGFKDIKIVAETLVTAVKR